MPSAITAMLCLRRLHRCFFAVISNSHWLQPQLAKIKHMNACWWQWQARMKTLGHMHKSNEFSLTTSMKISWSVLQHNTVSESPKKISTTLPFASLQSTAYGPFPSRARASHSSPHLGTSPLHETHEVREDVAWEPCTLHKNSPEKRRCRNCNVLF